MTCLVGISHEGIAYMGGDRGASDGDSILSLSRPKIAKRGEYLVGFSGSMGIGQLIHIIDLPAIGTSNVEKVLRTHLVKSLKSSIEEFANPVSDDNSASFLIGVKGRIFEVDTSDWQVAEFAETAVGSGSSIALGSLYTSNNYRSQEKRVYKAIESACEISPTCRYPIDVLKV